MRRSVAAGVTVLVLGWLWIAVLGTGPLEGRDEIALCPPFGETDDPELRTEWWPPARSRCEVERQGGVVAVRTTTPWDAWVLVLACAAAAAFLVARRPILAALLVIAGLAVFFLGLP